MFCRCNIVKYAVKTSENVALKHEKAIGSFSHEARRRFGGSLAPAGSTESERISRVLQTVAVQILTKSTVENLYALSPCSHIFCYQSVLQFRLIFVLTKS